VTLLALALALAGCGAGSGDGDRGVPDDRPAPGAAAEGGRAGAPAEGRDAPPDTPVLAALAPLPGGGLRAGTLVTGEIRDVVGDDGRLLERPRRVARVAVSTGGQRGLLGLRSLPAPGGASGRGRRARRWPPAGTSSSPPTAAW
jgi:hypothetical protein